jgi:hypothetical protein
MRHQGPEQRSTLTKVHLSHTWLDQWQSQVYGRVTRDAAPDPGFFARMEGREEMYIGVGTLVVILLIVIIVYFLRRA